MFVCEEVLQHISRHLTIISSRQEPRTLVRPGWSDFTRPSQLLPTDCLPQIELGD